MKLLNEKLGWAVCLAVAAFQLCCAWLSPQNTSFRIGLTLGVLFVFAAAWQRNTAKA